MTDKPDAPATERNRESILDVLRVEFENCKTVLEIGSGTGQHAVFFAEALPSLSWQTSDRQQNHSGINAWISASSLSNVFRPLDLDVEDVHALESQYDAAFSANTAHIMSFSAVKRMFELVGDSLRPNGRFCLYGPFKLNGKFTSDSNEHFDESLRAQDSRMGIRDLESLQEIASDNDLVHAASYAMPANNMLIVWGRN